MAFPLPENSNLPEEVIRDLVLMKLHAVGLRGACNLMPSELSGGMARRVALARAIATDPSLIIYDEPFAGLDPISLNTIANLSRKLNDALGVSSIVVTYDLSESLKIVDYVYFIHSGIVVAKGDVKEMLESDDPFVRQFLHGEQDGPIAFQYPSHRPYMEGLNMKCCAISPKSSTPSRSSATSCPRTPRGRPGRPDSAARSPTRRPTPISSGA